MKRTQIILEEWQHQWLTEEAKRQNLSMSALLRQLLTEAIERRQYQRPICASGSHRPTSPAGC
jgi:hypothetical protein